MAVGKKLGVCDGSFVGLAVGKKVGVTLGNVLGVFVGMAVGDTLGPFVGKNDGKVELKHTPEIKSIFMI